MSAYVLEFEIQALPKTPNALLGAHWRTRSSHAKRWERLVYQKVFPYLPNTPLKRARLILTRFSSRAPDADGLCGSFKCVVDALVKCKVIENDTLEHIGMPSYHYEKCAPKLGKIRVKVESL